jgi:hypothetical protein
MACHREVVSCNRNVDYQLVMQIIMLLKIPACAILIFRKIPPLSEYPANTTSDADVGLNALR